MALAEKDADVLKFLATGLIVGFLLGILLLTFAYREWRPEVLEWNVTLINKGSYVSTEERPNKVVWDGVVYDCVVSEDQGTRAVRE